MSKCVCCAQCGNEIPLGDIAYKSDILFYGIFCESCFEDLISDLEHDSRFEVDEYECQCDEERSAPDGDF